MELTAAIEALRILKCSCKIKLYTDSQYLKKGITEWIEQWIKNNWQTSNKKLVSNIDLWQSLDMLMQAHKIDWYWVQGHSGNIGNEIADRLAVKGKEEALKIINKQ